MNKNFLFVFLFVSIAVAACAQPAALSAGNSTKIIPAAERKELYLPLLQNKNVAVFANHTSVAGDEHLVDLLRKNNIRIVKIFAPEHGFRGTADAGQKIDNTKDPETGIPVISLYGKKRKPSDEDLRDVDVMVFDIQDVGARFYTYISSLQEYMESAIKNNKTLVVLDRPNPNGFYIDGPVLEVSQRSFIGMQPIPVVYGMTMGEYALMLKGEKWYDSSLRTKTWNDSKLKVIPCGNYTHNSRYSLPVKPSPNLPDMSAIYWYPSTCFFEGTVLSEGRGTEKPFQLFGHPALPDSLKAFTPRSIAGASKPKLLDQKCYGWDLSASPDQVFEKVNGQIQLSYLLNAYKLFPGKDSFFLKNNFFNRLAGNETLMKQIRDSKSEEEIRKSWQPGIKQFKQIRKKYLLYKDFE